MYTYAADSTTVSALTSFNEPPQTTNQAGQDRSGPLDGPERGQYSPAPAPNPWYSR